MSVIAALCEIHSSRMGNLPAFRHAVSDHLTTALASCFLLSRVLRRTAPAAKHRQVPEGCGPICSVGQRVPTNSHPDLAIAFMLAAVAMPARRRDALTDGGALGYLVGGFIFLI